jgi:hypothetical protein
MTACTLLFMGGLTAIHYVPTAQDTNEEPSWRPYRMFVLTVFLTLLAALWVYIAGG